jgi:hypothetical protein
VFEENQRRVWVPLDDIPDQVHNAFIAAEDKRCYQHKGIDERGLIRGYWVSLASEGKGHKFESCRARPTASFLVKLDKRAAEAAPILGIPVEPI